MERASPNSSAVTWSLTFSELVVLVFKLVVLRVLPESYVSNKNVSGGYCSELSLNKVSLYRQRPC